MVDEAKLFRKKFNQKLKDSKGRFSVFFSLFKFDDGKTIKKI